MSHTETAIYMPPPKDMRTVGLGSAEAAMTTQHNAAESATQFTQQLAQEQSQQAPELRNVRKLLEAAKIKDKLRGF